MDSREGAIATWEDRLAASECTLGKVIMERDTGHVRAKAVQQEFFTHMNVSSSWSKQLINLDQMLEECQILLCLKETDLEV
jgi:hypothetical protein